MLARAAADFDDVPGLVAKQAQKHFGNRGMISMERWSIKASVNQGFFVSTIGPITDVRHRSNRYQCQSLVAFIELICCSHIS